MLPEHTFYFNVRRAYVRGFKRYAFRVGSPQFAVIPT
jgi:hypothetical protein